MYNRSCRKQVPCHVEKIRHRITGSGTKEQAAGPKRTHQLSLQTSSSWLTVSCTKVTTSWNLPQLFAPLYPLLPINQRVLSSLLLNLSQTFPLPSLSYFHHCSTVPPFFLSSRNSLQTDISLLLPHMNPFHAQHPD